MGCHRVIVGACQKLLLIIVSVHITTRFHILTQQDILLTEAVFPKTQPELFFVLSICQECLFLYSSGNSTSGHYQNSLFHLKERIIFKAHIHLATSVWTFLQFPFTCFLRPSRQFLLLA